MSQLHTAVNALLAENEDFKLAGVKFPGSSKVYHYKTVLKLLPGELVVVPTNSSPKVVEVVELLDYEDAEDFQYKWIMSVVDTTAYDAINAKEEAIVKKLRAAQRKSVSRAALAALFNDVDEADEKEIRALVRL